MIHDEHNHPSLGLAALEKESLKKNICKTVSQPFHRSLSAAHINTHPKWSHSSDRWVMSLQLMVSHLFIHKDFLCLFLCVNNSSLHTCMSVHTEESFQRFLISSPGTRHWRYPECFAVYVDPCESWLLHYTETQRPDFYSIRRHSNVAKQRYVGRCVWFRRHRRVQQFMNINM